VTRLLLLHGNASSRESWRLVLDRLGGDVEAPDLPGFGAADARARTFADVLSEWVGRGPCIVGAAGATGLLAVRVALAHGDLVRGLVLVGPAGLRAGHGRLSGLGRRERGAAILRAAGSTIGRARFLGDQLANVGATPQDVRETLLDGLRGARSFAALARETTPAALDGARGLTCPVDVLWGDRSGVLPVSSAPELMERLPSHARLHVVDGAGHALALERPDAVASALVSARAHESPSKPRPHAPRGDRAGPP
jgi:pimeloyl-ACP methyl ester carboxylesterase